MKKIVIIIIIIFCTGCVDYKELNNLSYITGMGIDYVDDQYVITYEVMDNKKEGAIIDTQTFTVTSKGDNIYETGVNAVSKLSSSAYFSHTQVIIISEEVAENHLFELSDFVMRNPKLNEEFLLVMSQGSPEEILNTTTEENPSTAFYIYDLIRNNVYSQNFYIDMPFAIFVQKMTEDKYDPAISVISMTDNQEVILEGMAAFDQDKFITTMDNDHANLYNSFINMNTNISLNVEYKDDLVEAITKFENTNITVTDNKIKVKLNVIVELKKNSFNADLYELNTYNDIEKLLSDELNNKIHDFIMYLQKHNTDLLGFGNSYYISSRKDNNDLWRFADVDVESSLTISRRGLITNVHN